MNLSSAFKNKKIVIIGDLMLDHYVYGNVERISPEAPVPIMNFQSEEYRLGGAGNVALNVKSLGATPILVSLIGNDKYLQEITRIFDKEKMDDQGLIITNERKTTVKTRLMAHAQQLLRIDDEDTFDASQHEVSLIIKTLENIIKNKDIDIVILQDYNKGVLSEKIIQSCIEICTKYQVKFLVDPKRKNFFSYLNAYVFKPNLKELKEALPAHKINADPEVLNQIADVLHSKLNNTITIITLSEKGIFYKDHTQNVTGIIPTKAQNIADVSGAGDTVIATLAVGIAANLDIPTSIKIANEAAGIVCSKLGVIPINIIELENNFVQNV
ncbi:MAG: carbohydrate kinase [Saprospiraceae bacterium]|nr:carbohydrate kinase [Saprospiraceae bacterium]